MMARPYWRAVGEGIAMAYRSQSVAAPLPPHLAFLLSRLDDEPGEALPHHCGGLVPPLPIPCLEEPSGLRMDSIRALCDASATYPAGKRKAAP
jgi:hypothetical protein